MIMALLVTSFAVGTLTWWLGWWGVVVAALVAGALLGRRAAAWLVALAAVVAWCALFLIDAMGGRFATLASSIAGVMQVPARRPWRRAWRGLHRGRAGLPRALHHRRG